MAKITYSANLTDVRGKLGHVVHTKARSGKTLRSTAVPKRKATPAQTLQRSNLARAYKALTPAQLALWKAYAAGLTKTDPVTGKHYSPSPGTVFSALGSKFLQFNGITPVPTSPPPTPFAGDAITFTPLADVGSIYLTASNPNSEDTATEFWFQRLPSGARRPSISRATHAGFYQFLEDDLTASFNVTPGWVAVFVSYLRVTTGQKTGRVFLVTLKVPAA